VLPGPMRVALEAAATEHGVQLDDLLGHA
jgi:hypothetical protein